MLRMTTKIWEVVYDLEDTTHHEAFFTSEVEAKKAAQLRSLSRGYGMRVLENADTLYSSAEAWATDRLYAELKQDAHPASAPVVTPQSGERLVRILKTFEADRKIPSNFLNAMRGKVYRFRSFVDYHRHTSSVTTDLSFYAPDPSGVEDFWVANLGEYELDPTDIRVGDKVRVMGMYGEALVTTVKEVLSDGALFDVTPNGYDFASLHIRKSGLILVSSDTPLG